MLNVGSSLTTSNIFEYLSGVGQFVITTNVELCNEVAYMEKCSLINYPIGKDGEDGCGRIKFT